MPRIPGSAAQDSDDDLAEYYLKWTAESVQKLAALLQGQPDESRTPAETVEAFHAIAHDIKGMGGSFGYPLMSKVGSSFCAYLRGLNDDEAPDAEVADAHIRAMQVVLDNRITGDGGQSGERLIEKLESRAAAA